MLALVAVLAALTLVAALFKSATCGCEGGGTYSTVAILAGVVLAGVGVAWLALLAGLRRSSP